MLQDSTTVDATVIPMEKFLPSKYDFNALNERMLIIIKRVLSKHTDAFKSERAVVD